MSTTTAPLTVEEFLALPESSDQRRELIGCEVYTVPLIGYPHEVTKSNLFRILVIWLERNPVGRPFCETAFQVDGENCLIPDLSVVSPSRIVKGVFRGAPELAVEVVSSESASQLSRKVSLYLANGSKSVWTVFPEERRVWIYAAGHATEFQRNQVLEDPMVPGFCVPVSALFEGI